MQITVKTFCWFSLLFVLFTIVYFWVRLPLYHESLGFEEGIFAELITHQPKGPHYSLSGRINGQNVYSYIYHPAGPYELLRAGGKLMKGFLAPVYLDDAKITPRLRFVSSLYQFVFWSILLIFVFFGRSTARWPAAAVVFAAMLSPLSMKTSAYLQIDNTAGILLCGIAALLFVLADRNTTFKAFKFLLAIGGFIVGLGKQEWSIALAAALAITAAVYAIAKKERGKELVPLYIIAAGLLAGNLAIYAFDRVNYMQAFPFMAGFSKISSKTDYDAARWLILTKSRLPFISVCMVFFVFIVYFVINCRGKIRICTCLSAVFGLFLFAAYVVSDFSSQPRYFIPALGVLAVSLLAVMPRELNLRQTVVFAAALTMIVLSGAVFRIGFKPDRNLHLEEIYSGNVKTDETTVVYINDGACWNKPQIDYYNNNAPFEAVKNAALKNYNRRLIRVENVVFQ